MSSVNNKKGLGVCYNNKANVYKQLNKITEAIQYYIKSIENAKELSKLDVHHLSSLANRMMNLGVLYNEQNNFVESEKYFNESLQVHKTQDNCMGIAKVSGNLGQLYIKKNEFERSNQILIDAYNIIIEKNDRTSLQYVIYNIGILEYHKQNYTLAINHFVTLLKSYEKLDVYIQKNCLDYLSSSYKITENHDLAFAIGEMTKTSKNVYFVQDISGSMAGNPLTQCKTSIIKIIDQNLSQHDFISMTTFDTSVNLLFPLTQKNSNETKMYNQINSIVTNATTAFYDAIYNTIQSIPSTVTNNNWIVALTDGIDNASKISPSKLLKKMENMKINLIIITVGKLENENIITQMLSTVSNGIHFPVDRDNIQCAFSEVGSIIRGQVNVESL